MSTTEASSPSFDRAVRSSQDGPLTACSIKTVQVNIGLRCNLACRHCHVESSPKRDEAMTWPLMQRVLDVAERVGAETLDVTGGAPEMHPDFRRFIQGAVNRNLQVIVRTNLTILLEPPYTDLPRWLADRAVRLIASLPCYLPTNVDRQRGRHVFQGSIDAIKRLNAVGYGINPDQQLDLVYNPLGPTLPPDPKTLESAYRKELRAQYGLEFHRLLVMTNVPIGRFEQDLARRGESESYLKRLVEAFNPATLDKLMCRHQLHVGWDGTLYDCDFHFACGAPVRRTPAHIDQFDPDSFAGRPIRTASYCFACTAGRGSSCGGTLT